MADVEEWIRKLDLNVRKYNVVLTTHVSQDTSTSFTYLTRAELGIF
jgi:hypothetical protein